MSYRLCSDCEKNITCHNQVLPELIGQAKTSDLVGVHNYAEYAKMTDITVFYHYFFEDRALARIILQEGIVKSRICCMCVSCINNYLNSATPHYGDGAYGTANDALCPDSGSNPLSIARAHGIDFENRPYRAVVKIKNPSAFIKFKGTGGVLRSQPDNGAVLARGELYAHSINDAEVIRLEFWDGKEWMPF